jgi:pimeloyl-ACP methyl ester carboxylesterase
VTDPRPCAQNPSAACAPCAPLSLEEARRRFEREAERGVCDTGRYRCSYSSWGSGPPVLFVPGLSDNSCSFLLVTALLSGQFRCIAYDLPTGRGDGARLRRYRHAGLVEDLFALLDHLGVRQSYVYASSYGTTVALAAAHRRPERLPRLVLQSAFARRPLAPAERLLARAACFWPGSMGSLPLRDAVLRRQAYEPFAGRPPEFWHFFLDSTGRAPIAAVAHHALLLHRVDLRPLLAGVRQPVLLVSGDRDSRVSRACTEALLRGLPSAGYVELSDSGHFPFCTHPEALAEVVRGFLTPPAGGRG